MILAQAHEEGTFLERYFELLTDPAHWAFELTVTLVVDVFIGLVVIRKLWPLARDAAIKRHDRQFHDGHVHDGSGE